MFALIMALGQLSLAVLMVANFLLGSAKTLRDNAAFAVVPHLVPIRLLETAGGRIQATVLVTEELLGPPVGVLLFSLFEPAPLAMAAVFFGMAAWLLLGVEGAAVTTSKPGGQHRRAESGWRGVMADIVVGMRWLAAHRLLRTLCVLNALVNIGVVSVVTIAVLYAFEVLRVGQVVYATLLIVIAFGGVVGALSASALATRLGKGLVLQLAFVVAPLAFIVTGSTSSPYLAAGAFAFVGMSVSICNVISVALRQTLIPDVLLGRVNGAFRMVAFGLAPFGAVAAGFVAGHFGLRAPFLFGAILSMGIPRPRARASRGHGLRGRGSRVGELRGCLAGGL